MTDLATTPNGTSTRQRDDRANDPRQLPDLATIADNDDPLAEVRANLTAQLAAAATKLADAERLAAKNADARRRAERTISDARATIERCQAEAPALAANVKAAKDAETRIKGALAKLDPTKRAR